MMAFWAHAALDPWLWWVHQMRGPQGVVLAKKKKVFTLTQFSDSTNFNQ